MNTLPLPLAASGSICTPPSADRGNLGFIIKERETDRLSCLPLSRKDRSHQYSGNVSTKIFRDLRSVGYLLSGREREDYQPEQFWGWVLSLCNGPSLMDRDRRCLLGTLQLPLSLASLIYSVLRG